MKKYQVQNKIANKSQYDGSEPWPEISDDFVGDYIEAESPQEAIDIAINYLVEQIAQLSSEAADIEHTEDSITVDPNNELGKFAYYYDFIATPKGDE